MCKLFSVLFDRFRSSLGDFRLILIACGSLIFGCSTSFGDELEIRKSVLLALAKLDSISSVSLGARYSSDRGVCENVSFEKLGKRFVFSGDLLPGTSLVEIEASRKMLERTRNLLGDPSSAWLMYDGQRLFEYAPQRSGFGFYKVSEPPEPAHLVKFDPSYWSKLLSKVPVKLVLETLDHRELKAGLHEFSKEFSSVPDNPVAYNRIVLIADESKGWNIVSAEFEGGAFAETKTETSWAQADDSWYPINGKILRKGKVAEEWEITKVSFDPRDVSAKFQFDQQSLPVGIKISEGKPGTEQKIRFVGGKDGERQYRLIMGLNNLGPAK